MNDLLDVHNLTYETGKNTNEIGLKSAKNWNLRLGNSLYVFHTCMLRDKHKIYSVNKYVCESKREYVRCVYNAAVISINFHTRILRTYVEQRKKPPHKNTFERFSFLVRVARAAHTNLSTVALHST